MIYIKGFTPLERGESLSVSDGNATNKIFKHRRFLSLTGFTLIELMIVVLIVGILAAVALPLYSKAVERGRISEAVNMLGTMREAQMRYISDYGTYTNNAALLDIGITSTIGRYFSFSALSSADPFDSIDDDIAYATRNPSQAGVFQANYVINISENGTLRSNDAEVSRFFP